MSDTEEIQGETVEMAIASSKDESEAEQENSAAPSERNSVSNTEPGTPEPEKSDEVEADPKSDSEREEDGNDSKEPTSPLPSTKSTEEPDDAADDDENSEMQEEVEQSSNTSPTPEEEREEEEEEEEEEMNIDETSEDAENPDDSYVDGEDDALNLTGSTLEQYEDYLLDTTVQKHKGDVRPTGRRQKKTKNLTSSDQYVEDIWASGGPYDSDDEEEEDAASQTQSHSGPRGFGLPPMCGMGGMIGPGDLKKRIGAGGAGARPMGMLAGLGMGGGMPDLKQIKLKKTGSENSSARSSASASAESTPNMSHKNSPAVEKKSAVTKKSPQSTRKSANSGLTSSESGPSSNLFGGFKLKSRSTSPSSSKPGSPAPSRKSGDSAPSPRNSFGNLFAKSKGSATSGLASSESQSSSSKKDTEQEQTPSSPFGQRVNLRTRTSGKDIAVTGPQGAASQGASNPFGAKLRPVGQKTLSTSTGSTTSSSNAFGARLKAFQKAESNSAGTSPINSRRSSLLSTGTDDESAPRLRSNSSLCPGTKANVYGNQIKRHSMASNMDSSPSSESVAKKACNDSDDGEVVNPFLKFGVRKSAGRNFSVETSPITSGRASPNPLFGKPSDIKKQVSSNASSPFSPGPTTPVMARAAFKGAESISPGKPSEDDVPEWKKNLRKRASKPSTAASGSRPQDDKSNGGSHEFQKLILRKRA